MKKIHPFHVFTAAVILILVLPQMLQHGMFMDGTQYACVARNLAFGKGTFWRPHLSDSWSMYLENSFLEHPPLVYFLQAGFFLVLGDTIYAERIYSFFILLLCIFIIYKIWEQIKVKDARATSWLPVLLWFIFPSVFWGFRSNVIENTLSLFVLLSFYFSLKSLNTSSKRILFLFLSGLSVFFASLSKGIPGFFPLTFFFLYAVITKKLPLKQAIFSTTIILAIPFVIYLMLVGLSSDAAYSLNFYLTKRLLYRINENPLVDNWFMILYWFVCEFLVPLGVTIIALILFKIKNISPSLDSERKKLITFFFLFGLSGLLPLMLTHVQRAPYYIPSLPFFAFALALVLERKITDKGYKIQQSRSYVWMQRISAVIVISVVVYSFTLIGKIERDKEVLEDVFTIGNALPANSHIDVPKSIYDKWDFQLYLLRYYNIVLWPHKEKRSGYYLCEKNSICDTLSGYEPLPLNIRNYTLYKKPE